jgi:hypothetical protein
MNALKKVENLFESFQNKTQKPKFEPKICQIESAYIDHSATVTDK